MGMMLKTKRTVGHRITMLAALAQAALLLFWGATASAQDGNTLQDIQVQSLPGERVELKLIMSDTAPEPMDFTIENPARIALDLPDTSLGLASRRRDVNLGPLDTVLTAEANGRTRVVLNLGTMVHYETRRSGNTVTITLGDEVPPSSPVRRHPIAAPMLHQAAAPFPQLIFAVHVAVAVESL
jgi:type IV pilus assembly protein PilQ